MSDDLPCVLTYLSVGNVFPVAMLILAGLTLAVCGALFVIYVGLMPSGDAFSFVLFSCLLSMRSMSLLRYQWSVIRFFFTLLVGDVLCVILITYL